jgi:hypothetical protein
LIALLLIIEGPHRWPIQMECTITLAAWSLANGPDQNLNAAALYYQSLPKSKMPQRRTVFGRSRAEPSREGKQFRVLHRARPITAIQMQNSTTPAAFTCSVDENLPIALQTRFRIDRPPIACPTFSVPPSAVNSLRSHSRFDRNCVGF